MRFISGLFLFVLIAAAWPCASGQSIHSGTVTGTVTDASHAVIPGARVELKNAVTGYAQASVTDAAGSYRFNNVPQNQYVLTAGAQSFATMSQTVDVRSAVPVDVPLTLNVAGSSTAVQVNADPDQLEQMFINLLANAVDASLSRGSQTVRMGWKVDAGSVVVTIEDRGLGIANAENLFVPFYTTKPSGSGVGLALAQQIARAHGGDVQLVNREDGEGARASIRLPAG